MLRSKMHGPAMDVQRGIYGRLMIGNGSVYSKAANVRGAGVTRVALVAGEGHGTAQKLRRQRPEQSRRGDSLFSLPRPGSAATALAPHGSKLR